MKKDMDEKILKIKELIGRFNPPIDYTIKKVSESKLKIKAPKHILSYIKENIDGKLFEAAKSYKELLKADSKEFPDTTYILEDIGGVLYITRDIDSNLSTVKVDEEYDLDNMTKEDLVSLGDRINKEMRFGL